MKNRWVTFAPFFSSWCSIPAFLNIWVNGNKAITNSNVENKLPWNITLLMGTNASSSPSAYKLVFHLFKLYLIRPMILSAKPTILIVAMRGGPYRRPSCSPPRSYLNLSLFPAIVQYVSIYLKFIFCPLSLSSTSFLFFW